MVYQILNQFKSTPLKKIALYWQILIAFALSVLYGLFFSGMFILLLDGDIYQIPRNDYHSSYFHFHYIRNCKCW